MATGVQNYTLPSFYYLDRMEGFLGFVFFMLVMFFVVRRIAQAAKQDPKAQQRLRELLEQRRQEALGKSVPSARPTAQPQSFDELLNLLSGSTLGQNEPPPRKPQMLSEVVSEVERSPYANSGPSLESQLKSYESLTPLAEQLGSVESGSIEQLLPHYERIEEIQSQGHHPIYGRQDDMSHAHTPDSPILPVHTADGRAQAKAVHPLITYLRHGHHLRHAFLSQIVFQRPEEQ